MKRTIEVQTRAYWKTTIGIFALLAPILANAADLPAGWFKAGSHPAEYDAGIDTAIRHAGRASGTVKATASELHGFGTLMQTATGVAYRGKRIRFSGYVKSEHVQSGWAGLWLRIDGAARGEVLGFDNMQHRPIKGTTDWKRYEIVLDVPDAARAIAFGLLLSGDGQVWMDDLAFEVVTSDARHWRIPKRLTSEPQFRRAVNRSRVLLQCAMLAS
jgi:hypothetical protein